MSFDPQMLTPLGLNQENKNRFLIERKVGFTRDDSRFHIQLNCKELMQCLNFSWEMAYGKGYHKPVRSGGSESRRQKKIFENVLTGKVGEIAFYKMCIDRARCKAISEVDFDSYGAGEWDESDFEVTCNQDEVYKIAVKSSQFYANLLLLEVDDWTVKAGRATYKHNEEDKGDYDYIIFCRVKFSESKPNFFEKYADKLAKKEGYSEIAHTETVTAEVVGYIVNEDLVSIMKSNHIIKRNDYMTQNRDKDGMKLDADNYYIQAGCLRKIRTHLH